MAPTVSVPTIRFGFWIATRGSLAAALCSASIERLIPGAITPPSKAPSAPITSNVVAVPLSMTISSPG
jgi:hypothetical protein